MTDNTRRCANCAAFNPDPIGNQPACGNLVFFSQIRDDVTASWAPTAQDACMLHVSHWENLQKDEFLARPIQ